MDRTDYKIIELLQVEGRISMKDLGLQVGLTAPAVSERVKKMEESGIITGYKACIDPSKLNRNIMAFIDIAMAADRYTAFLQFATTRREVVECHHVTGGDCMTIKVLVRNMMELEGLIDDIKKMGNTRTSLILSSPIESKPVALSPEELK